jgi:hypothetical protein
LANAGCSTDQIKAITGHKALSEVARYTKAADQQRLARQALRHQTRGRTGTGFVQPPNPVGQNAVKVTERSGQVFGGGVPGRIAIPTKSQAVRFLQPAKSKF